MDRKGNWFQTVSGRRFYVLDIRPEDIVIEDIAHALAMKCRFGGHCSAFFSVAEHSVAVSRMCGREDALAGLLHDAAEAYTADLPAPVKRMPEFVAFTELERRVMAAIFERFGVALPLPAAVHAADREALGIEAVCLMNAEADPGWAPWVDGTSVRLARSKPPRCLDPDEARREFLTRFEFLVGEI
jgi:hypothetical protein